MAKNTLYSRRNRDWFFVDRADFHETLPTKTFCVMHSQQLGFFLQEAEGFVLPEKRYGDTDKLAKRILNTFRDRGKATGVLLSGEKGSGKSLQAKTLSNLGISEGLPTILVNHAFHGEAFNQFIQKIEQPCIIIFDEFEKTYSDKDSQEGVLTLLDSVVTNNCLFVFTVNNKYRIDENMRNRPGRLFYAIDYEGLTIAFIKQYCEENLKNKAYIDTVPRVCMIFRSFNFDMLKSLVEEMNRYDESPQDALKVLNIKAEFDSVSEFVVKLKHPSLISTRLYTTKWKGNPLLNQVSIEGYFKDPKKKYKKDDDEGDYHSFAFTAKHIVKVDPDDGRFDFKLDDGVELSLSREVYKNHGSMDRVLDL